MEFNFMISGNRLIVLNKDPPGATGDGRSADHTINRAVVKIQTKKSEENSSLEKTKAIDEESSSRTRWRINPIEVIISRT